MSPLKKRTRQQHPILIDSLSRRQFITVLRTHSVGEALRGIRANAPKGDIFYIYVTDEDQTLYGVVSIRGLLAAQDEETVEKVCSRKVVWLPTGMSLNDAYPIFANAKFLSLPIVDSQGAIVGVLDAHTLLGQKEQKEELFEERSRSGLFEVLGIHAETKGRSIKALASDRFPWLMLNLLGGAVSALLIHFFMPQVPNAVAAFAFVPALLLMSESIGMQTATVVVGNLHRSSGKINFRELALKEIAISLMLGVVASIVVAFLLSLFPEMVKMVPVLCSTLVLGSLFVALVGNFIPILFFKLRLDPRLAAGPIVLAISDSGVILIYLSCAALFSGVL